MAIKAKNIKKSIYNIETTCTFESEDSFFHKKYIDIWLNGGSCISIEIEQDLNPSQLQSFADKLNEKLNNAVTNTILEHNIKATVTL